MTAFAMPAWLSRIGVMVCLLCPASGWAQIDGSFALGNTRYQQGDYAGALEAYRQVVEAGYESAAVYYNLGNTHFKLGNLGLAILNYERAARLDPRDDDVAANLALARSLTADEIDPLPRFWLVRAWEWWLNLLPLSALGLLVAVAYVGTIAGVAVRIWYPTRALGTWGTRVAFVAALISVVFGINLFVRELGIGRAPHAIVLADEVAVQSAPSDDRDLRVFTIHEGARVRIDQRSGTWAEIVLDDGKVGWVDVEVFEEI